MEITEKILLWLVDSRNYKNTFRFVVYNMTEQEKQYAEFLVDEIRYAGLLSKEYEVENSFVAYSKAGYNTLLSVIRSEPIDSD